jgi:hypothetical protein
MSEFKVGQVVRCIEQSGDYLQEESLYQITFCDGFNFVQVVCLNSRRKVNGLWSSWRFSPLS